MSTFLPAFDSRNLVAALVMLALNAPASPLSPVTTISSMFFSSRCASKGCLGSPVSGSSISARATSDFSTLLNICAYGRAAITRSCARRSLAAETIFMALVICCVFLTDRIRRRMSIKLGMVYMPSGHCGLIGVVAHELLFQFRDDVFHLGLQIVV